MPIVTDPDPSGSIDPTLAFLCGIAPSGVSLGVDNLRQRARFIGMLHEGGTFDHRHRAAFIKEHLAKNAESGTL